MTQSHAGLQVDVQKTQTGVVEHSPFGHMAEQLDSSRRLRVLQVVHGPLARVLTLPTVAAHMRARELGLSVEEIHCSKCTALHDDLGPHFGQVCVCVHVCRTGG